MNQEQTNIVAYFDEANPMAPSNHSQFNKLTIIRNLSLTQKKGTGMIRTSRQNWPEFGHSEPTKSICVGI